MADPVVAAQIEQLAHAIAGAATDEETARIAQKLATAEIDIARIRHAKVAAIEMMRTAGRSSRSPKPGESPLETVGSVDCCNADVPPRPPQVLAMATPDSDQDAEAIRRALAALQVFDRYEQGAWLRRNRALAEMQLVAQLRNLNQ